MAARIKAGRMRQRIQAISWVSVQDAYGEEVRTNETPYIFNGALIPISSKEIINSGQVQGYATHRLITRYNKAQPLKMVNKLQYDGRIFQVVDIVDIDELSHKVVALLRETVE